MSKDRWLQELSDSNSGLIQSILLETYCSQIDEEDEGVILLLETALVNELRERDNEIKGTPAVVLPRILSVESDSIGS
jgi:hypothetical protein